MSKVLVVDDERSIRNTFDIFLSKEGHEVFLAENACDALKTTEEHGIDLVITDIVMPKATGIDLLYEIKAIKQDVPVIIMTGEPTVNTAREAVKSDATDYLIKPVSKENLLKATKYALDKKHLIDQKVKLEQENANHRKNLETLVKKRTEELQKAVNGTIHTIAKMFELKDPYTAVHEKRVGLLSLAIARKMGLGEQEQKRIYFAGYLHDIGKILVPSEILSKPGKLTKGEFEVIKEHALRGSDMTKEMQLPWSISDIILQHHERMDGSGYPNGIRGEEIKLEARIIAVADVVEAMTAHRPYRPGFGIETALEEIASNCGGLYDDSVCEEAISLFNEDGYDFSDNSNMIMI